MDTRLGPGEREALALAREPGDPLLLLDDRAARTQARLLGISFTGTLGVLLRAKRESHVDAISPLVDSLEASGFRLDPSTRAAVLRLAGE